ncbi:MAG: AMP-binding protein [Rhodospirillales bacterium]|nr:AMP-binding protein [Rhodospirillales bacterium]
MADPEKPDAKQASEQAENLLLAVMGLVAELRPDAAGKSISLDDRFDRDLGLDSLSRVELIARVETAFDIALPDAVLASAETPRDLLRALGASQGRTPFTFSSKEPEAARLAKVGALPDRAETLLDVLDWHVANHPERPHLRLYEDDGEGEVLAYADLDEGARKIASGLIEGGLMPGEAVLLMLPTGKDYFFGFYGALLAGGVPVPVYPPARLTQLEEHMARLAGIAQNCRATAMITFAEAGRLGGLLKARAETIRQVETAENLMLDGTPDIARPPVKASDTAFLQYTSGSTGQPKGVVLSHANLLANIRAMGQALKAGPDDVIVSWLPLYHDMGLIGAWLGSLYHAAHFVVMPPLSFLARPVRWLRAIHRYGGTISAAPNFAYEMCLRRISDTDIEQLDLSSWRIAANGAEPVSPDTLRRFCEKFAAHGFARTTMMPMFGLAENCVGLAFPPLDRGPLIDRVKRRTLAGSGRAEPADDTLLDADIIEFPACGRPIPGHEIRIADEAGRELPERTEGRLQFRGPSATSGYFRNAQATETLFDGDWLDSGDRAYIAEGDVYVTGRAKDMIIRAGRNIYPAEIEDAVGELEGVLKGNVAVFGSAAPESGTERLIVLAETRRRDAGAQASIRDNINGLVTDLLGSPADQVVLAPPNTVAKTSSGKIRRDACRQVFEADLIGKGRRAIWLQTLRSALSSATPLFRRSLRAIAEWIFAGWFWFVLAVLTGPLVWLAVVTLPGARLRWRIARFGARLLLRLSGLLPALRGGENLPQEGADFILVSNHASYLDGCVLVAALPRPVAFVAKGELAPQLVAGTFLRRLGAVFVERFDAEKSAADAERIAETTRDLPLLYFPEGTLTRAPGLLPFQMGAFAAAARANQPMVPLAIRGTRNVLRDGSWFPRPGRITVTVDTPVQPDEAESDVWKRALELRGRVRRRLLRLIAEPDLDAERSPVRENSGDRS